MLSSGAFTAVLFSIVSVDFYFFSSVFSRPEKNHRLQLEAFQRFREVSKGRYNHVRLTLMGGVRNAADGERVQKLREYAAELGVADAVEFSTNASFDALVDASGRATVGLHTMTDEHFGISVVEYMVAGLVTLAHDSAGPAQDICLPDDQGRPVGFVARTADDYAQRLCEIFDMKTSERQALAARARAVADERFSDALFRERFVRALAL